MFIRKAVDPSADKEAERLHRGSTREGLTRPQPPRCVGKLQGPKRKRGPRGGST
jgi:hypothetical protein